MKKLSLVVLFILIPNLASGFEWRVTKEGHLYAFSKEHLVRAYDIAASGDKKAYVTYCKLHSVAPLKGGLSVWVEETTWGGWVKVRPKGHALSVWTVRKALK